MLSRPYDVIIIPFCRQGMNESIECAVWYDMYDLRIRLRSSGRIIWADCLYRSIVR